MTPTESDAFTVAIKKIKIQADALTGQVEALRRDLHIAEAKRDALLLATQLLEDSVPRPDRPTLPAALIRTPRIRMNVKEAILAELRESGRVRSVEQLCSILNRRRAQIDPALKKLVEEGRVGGQTGNGYAVVPPVEPLSQEPALVTATA